MEVDSPDGLGVPSRSIDIEIGGQEIVTIDLDNLDPSPQDVLDLLQEANCSEWIWTQFASEYWRKGWYPAAERILETATQVFNGKSNSSSALWPIYAFQANVQLANARKAPKVVLSNARRDVMSEGINKEHYYKEAAGLLNKADAARGEAGIGASGQNLLLLTRAIYRLSTRSMDEALQHFDMILQDTPTNVVALMGKARIFYAKRDWPHALKLFQDVLTYCPSCKPDPRVGIGLCLWAMGNREKAKAAWQRSLEVNPGDWAAQVLLGLEAINCSKDSNRPEEERISYYAVGSKYIERAFKANNRNASAANALSEFFLRKNDLSNAMKLAERTIQCADTLTLLSDGHLRAARVFHAEGSTKVAAKHYQASAEGQQNHTLSAIGLAQMQLQADEVSAAIHTLESLQTSSSDKSLEATVMLASMRANARPGVSSADAAADRLRARDMYDHFLKAIETVDVSAGPSTRTVRNLGDDMEMHLEIARLWQDDNLDRMSRALKEAIRIGRMSGKVDPRLTNNLAALKQMEGDLDEARAMYEDALRAASQSTAEADKDMPTTILYNLGRVYEDQGAVDMAKDAYEKLLERYPEYVDAKIRQAHILRDLNQTNEAHELLKQALSAASNNLNLRAFYIYFLIQSNMLKTAKDFVFATLKDHDKHDIYSLCSAGWIMYQQARENRETTPEGVKARRRGFERSAELYEKALSLDPLCAFAAQGLAIVTAEDSLGTLTGPAPLTDDSLQRAKYAREALDVFAKVRESMNDGSVYANMGHCYYARDEFDRALESYETASKKFYNDRNVPVLLCLSRTNYAKATKDQSYAHVTLALNYAEQALHIHPSDKAVMYNIAMIQQKAAEMLFALSPAKRSLVELRRGIEQAAHAQKLFAALAADDSPSLPYNRDVADQRRKYGESMLRKGDEHLAAQENHEAESRKKIEAARLKRQQEKDRMIALENERLDSLKQAAELLAEERRKAREEAMQWTAAARAASDEEKERERDRKTKRSKRVKADGESDGEDGVAEPKKKRKGKLKKAGSAGVEDPPEDGALFSGDEDGKPKKRIPKKRVVRDDDDNDENAGPRKKQIKSKATISDSDEEME